ncbi:MAG: hypothetical protein K6357_07835 [Elusimicrobiota bacterium]
MNIITGSLGIDMTVEGNIGKIAGTEEINIFDFAIKTILSNPLNYFLSIIRRLLFFAKINFFILALALFSIIKNRNSHVIKIITIFSVYFVFLHSMFSVEKRYFFPVTFILTISGVLFKKNEEKDLILIDKKFKTILFVLALVCGFSVFKISLYPFLKKPLDDILSHKKILLPSAYLALATDDLEYLKSDKAKEKLNIFLAKSRENSIKQEISKLVKAAWENDFKPDPHYYKNYRLFNIPLVLSLKYIKNKDYNNAREIIENHWNLISDSYVRNPTNSIEIQLDSELKNCSKTQNIDKYVALISSSITEMKSTCKEFNSIIESAGKKQKFDCEFNSRIISKYIYDFCFNPETNTIEQTIMEIVNFEKRGEFNKAIEKAENLRNLYPAYYKPYAELGNIYLILKKPEEARLNYEKALSLCGYAIEPYHGLIVIYILKKKIIKPF